MKYVSCTYMSTGIEARKIPVKPPIRNIATKAQACAIGTVMRIEPRQSVASQLKILTPVGTAMTIVATMKLVPSAGFIPLTNMWCAHTIKPSTAMAAIA